MRLRLRCFIFRMAFHRAHKAMKLGSSFPVADLPPCYLSEEYISEAARAQKRSHIVVGMGQYTFWFDEGERASNWTSWTVSTPDEFIKRFYNTKIHGEFALYPLIITQLLYGRQIEFLLQGKANEFEEKRLVVKNAIALSLEHYLNSISFRVIAQMLAFA